MRILVVSNLYPPVERGGYERECWAVARRLAERGDELLVLTSSLERERAPAGEEGVLRELPFLRYRPDDSLRAPAAALRGARSARDALARFRPELVFVWNGAQIPHSALYVLGTAGVPLAFRVCEHWFGRLFTDDRFMRHLYPGDRGLRRAWAGLVRGINRLPQLRLDPGVALPAAISWNSETIRRLAGTPPAVRPTLERVIHSTTFRADLFAAVERAPNPEPTIAFVGRVSPEKGPDVAVRALARLEAGHGLRARLVLAGPVESGLEARLRELAAAEGVGERVQLAGRLDGDGLAALLAEAAALVVPSVWEEPFPLVCIEGAFARCPVVASDIGGIPECLRPGEHALLFPPGDAGACADALAAVLTRPQETAARVARAYERASELSFERYLRESERFVDDAVASFGARTAA